MSGVAPLSNEGPSAAASTNESVSHTAVTPSDAPGRRSDDVQARAERLPQAEVVDHDRVVGVEREDEHREQHRRPERGHVGLLEDADAERERRPMQTSSSTSRTTDGQVGRGKPPVVASARMYDARIQAIGQAARTRRARRPRRTRRRRRRRGRARPRACGTRRRSRSRSSRTCPACSSAPITAAAAEASSSTIRVRPGAVAAARAPGATSSRADCARPVGRGSSA